ncbi:MAG: ATPase domain-containing protein, partial [Methanotrichaceae archaeon]
MRNTFKDTITGLEKVFDSDIPKGSVVLVVGTEGTLKSTLVLNMLSNYLINRAEHGLYITLEQAKDSHLKNMEGIGIRRADSLEIFDYRDLRREWEDFEPDMVRMTEEILKFYEDKYRNLTVFALDSLNALHALSEVENSRRSMYHFFS